MATVFYDKAAVSVEWGDVGETLLASDFTVNYSTSATPLYSIGSKGALGQFPSAARVGDVSFNLSPPLQENITGRWGILLIF